MCIITSMTIHCLTRANNSNTQLLEEALHHLQSCDIGELSLVKWLDTKRPKFFLQGKNGKTAKQKSCFSKWIKLHSSPKKTWRQLPAQKRLVWTLNPKVSMFLSHTLLKNCGYSPSWSSRKHRWGTYQRVRGRRGPETPFVRGYFTPVIHLFQAH